MARRERRRSPGRDKGPAVVSRPVVGPVVHIREVVVKTATGNLIHFVGTPGMTLRAFCEEYTKGLGTWRYAHVNGKSLSWNYHLRDGDVVTFKGGPFEQGRKQKLYRGRM